MSTRINIGNVSTQGSVTIQCTHDVEDMRNRRNYVGYTKKDGGDAIVVYDAPLADAPSQGIRANDLVYQSITSRVPKSFLSKSAQPVLSALNGLYCNHDASQVFEGEDERIAELSKKIRFIGVACTDTYFGTQENTQTQVTVRTRGTHTILNNSTVPINFGDLVMWKIPNTEERKQLAEQRADRYTGTLSYAQANESIVQLMTVPYSHAEYDISSILGDEKITTLLNKLTAEVTHKTSRGSSSRSAGEQSQNKSNEIKDCIANILKTYLHQELSAKEDAERRIIGRALSFAKPGTPIDILLF